MLRSAFALGGFGSGIARDRKDLVKITTQVGMGGWWGVGRLPCDAAVSLRARRLRVGDSEGQEGLGQDRYSGRNGGGGVWWWVGYPVMLRSAFALGGFGSGIARDRKDLVKIATQVGMGGDGWWGVCRLPCDAAVSLRARRVRVRDSEGQEGLGQDRHSGRNGGVVGGVGWVGYPVMLRSAFALGGFGSGIARDRKDMVKIATQV